MATLSHGWPLMTQAGMDRVRAALQIGCTAYVWNGKGNSARCGGEMVSLVRRTIRTGTVIVSLQCDACGGNVGGGAMKRDNHPGWENYPEWNADLVAEKEREGEERARVWRDERERETNDRAAYQRQWWDDYDRYLRTPLWRSRSACVLQRANGTCEGCGSRPATQAHHKRYPKECLPGSEVWIAKEKLFDLVAVCERCHEDVHS